MDDQQNDTGHEQVPPASSGRRRIDSRRAGSIARTALSGLAACAAWVLVANVWTDLGVGEGAWFLGMLVATAVLAGITVLVIVSLRFPRLRAAFAPVEFALIVGMAIFVGGTRGQEVDTTSDIAGIAMLFAAATVVLLSFLSVLLLGRRSRGTWMAGVATFLAASGIALPVALDTLEGDYDPALFGLPSGSATVMSLHAGPGRIRLGSNSYEGFVEAGGPSSPAPSTAQLRAATDGSLFVVIGGGAGELRAQRVELRHGACSRARGTVAHWKRIDTGAVDARRELPVTGLRLDDLEWDDDLHVRWGSGAPLAPVSCSNVLSGHHLVLARAGAAQFLSTCVDPLSLEPAELRMVRAESFQDEACAGRMRTLSALAETPPFHSRELAESLRRCVTDAGAKRAKVGKVAGGAWVVRLASDDDRSVLQRCATSSPHGLGATMPGPVAGGTAVEVDPLTGAPIGPYPAAPVPTGVDEFDRMP